MFPATHCPTFRWHGFLCTKKKRAALCRICCTTVDTAGTRHVIYQTSGALAFDIPSLHRSTSFLIEPLCSWSILIVQKHGTWGCRNNPVVELHLDGSDPLNRPSSRCGIQIWQHACARMHGFLLTPALAGGLWRAAVQQQHRLSDAPTRAH